MLTKASARVLDQLMNVEGLEQDLISRLEKT